MVSQTHVLFVTADFLRHPTGIRGFDHPLEERDAVGRPVVAKKSLNRTPSVWHLSIFSGTLANILLSFEFQHSFKDNTRQRTQLAASFTIDPRSLPYP